MRFAPDSRPISANILDMDGLLVDSDLLAVTCGLDEARPWLAAGSVGRVAR